ncbi:hypothetical protein ACLOJK_041779 [Asimina triloba]
MSFDCGMLLIVKNNAVCLDGSPPAYHMSRGFGAGINNWLVHFEVRNARMAQPQTPEEAGATTRRLVSSVETLVWVPLNE